MNRERLIAQRLARVRSSIRAAARAANRDPRDVKLIAVTKYATIEAIRAALAAGQRDFAENYVQSAESKIRALAASDARWHFIGRLQSNKAARAARLFDCIQTLASESALRALANACRAAAAPCTVFVQIRLVEDPSRPGISPDDAEAFVRAAVRHDAIVIDGVMGIAPQGMPARPYFARLREVAESVRALRLQRAPVREISAGMSNDFVDAIAEGATMVRIGSAIFGPKGEQSG